VTKAPVAPVVPPKLPDIVLRLVTAGMNPDKEIQPLNDGDEPSRNVTKTNISIEATCPDCPSISKITFLYNNKSQVESGAPYLLAGNNGLINIAVDYLKTNGMKTVGVKVYDVNSAVIAERTIVFTIVA
jgi:hypothetical protein